MQFDLTLVLSFLEKAFVVLLAPAGIWFGWLLQHKDKAEDRAQQQQERLRDKAEEIYAELSAVQDVSKAALLHALRDLQGTLEGPPGFSPDVKFDRLNALLWMYFPGAEQIMVNHTSAIYESAKKHSELFAKVQGDQSLAVEEKLKRVKQSTLDQAKANQALTTETVAKLTMFMNQEVKKLL
ncbi:hypothetical protein [Sphingomonas sp. URHD0057]|uniref:hypothetical protein n=1 Tax=Sphingomonas sp. URHD0057 TaxID=1380389 RepID=UPI00048B3F6B|nr:hypothetical protein [Sphingomonas sp. URHD0057]